MISIKGLFVFSFLLVSVFADCPNVKDSDISPCVCLSDQIRCEGSTVTNEVLKTVLGKVDKARPAHLKNLEGIELYNTKVTNLTTEIFGQLVLRTFVKLNSNPITSLELGNFPDLVLLDASNNQLSNITSNTLLGLKDLKFVSFANNGIEWFPKDTFSMSDNLVRIDLSNNKIKKLNSDEFSSEYHNLIQLQEVDLSYNDLTSLPSNIFWPLRTPKVINLGHNKLNDMEDNALSFGEDVWQYEPTKIVLADNGLKDNDLKSVTFAHIVRQKLAIDLDLSVNQLTHLDEKIFHSLLSTNANTRITLNNNPIKCADCGNKWIFVDKKVNPKAIKSDKCSDDPKRTLSEFTEADYKKCP